LLNQLREAHKSSLDRKERADEAKVAIALQEMRVKVAMELRDAANEVALRGHVYRLNENINASREVLHEELETNTRVSTQAFNEANHVNNKIANLQAALLDNKHVNEQSNRIEATGVDTNRKVTDLGHE
jgi:hypothetical protein